MRPTRFHDEASAVFVRVAAPFLRFLAYNRANLPKFSAASDRANIQLRTTHFYEPTYDASHLPDSLEQERSLPGLDLNEEVQLSLLKQFRWASELAEFPLKKPSDDRFGFEPAQFSHGDADLLFSFVRHFKPKRIVEIGSGDSTLIAGEAIIRNKQDDQSYSCCQICIEPYASPWLETIGAKIIRGRVEHIDLDVFLNLEENDILFIDSSHVIRPFGDVLQEFLEIVPRVAPGVIVHVHDIFTPRDYPSKWIREERKLWNEQYLLEGFLSFNNEFEVLAAANWLLHHHPIELKKTCGYPEWVQGSYPGSFWFRRKPS